jgi:serine phosphatase RsbU (regulator of sigma subunit)
LSFLNKPQGLPDGTITDLLATRQGQVLLGTANTGLAVYLGARFELFLPGMRQADVKQSINQVTLDSKGILYYTFNAGIYRFDGQRHTRLSGTDVMENDVFALAVDAQDNLWAGSLGGLYQFRNGRFIREEGVQGIPTAMQLLPDGRLIVGAVQEGLFEVVGGKPSLLPGTEGLVSQVFTSFATDGKGTLWVGTNGQGLVRYAQGKTYTYTNTQGLPNDRITQLVWNAKGQLWIATPSGLARLENVTDQQVKFKTFVKELNLLSPNLWLLVEDAKGRLWVGHEKGIERVDPQTLTVRAFGKQDGFLPRETTARGAVRDARGVVWYATIDGLVRYEPAEDKDNLIPPIPRIEEIRLFNQPVDDWAQFAAGFDAWLGLPTQLELPYNQNFLTFQYTGAHFATPEKITFQYKLEGLDSDWQPETDQRQITYNNLDAGTYTFLVRARNADGAWTPRPASFTFTLHPPFWKRWWFYLLYPLVLGGLIYGFVRYRIRALEDRKRELEEEVQRATAQIQEELHRNEKLNEELKEKNQDITDSIEYARRLQGVLLPDLDVLSKLLPESFVLYQPRDIVSGDFYWYFQTERYLYLAGVDCTGHGVPGAFMSVLGNNLLNQIFHDYQDPEPALVLKQMNERVMEALRQYEQGSTTKDGMEIGLARLDLNSYELVFAGANRPLYLYKGGEMLEVKGTKAPIGGGQYGQNPEFVANIIELAPGDAFYLTSDGYGDQFGGPKNRKYTTARLRELLLQIQPLGMPEQMAHMQGEMDTWRGERQQMDDILVIGVRRPRVSA